MNCALCGKPEGQIKSDTNFIYRKLGRYSRLEPVHYACWKSLLKS